MRLGPIKSRVPLGSSIRVRVQGGEYLEGILLDIDDDCLILNGGAGEIILEASAIELVERRLEDAQGTANPVPSSLPRPSPEPVPEHVEFPDAAILYLQELEAAIRGMALEIAEPEFSVYTSDLDIETKASLHNELNSVRSRYSFALKMKEKDRVLQCIGGLRKIAEHYNAPDALQIAGRMAWHLGDRKSALGLFAEAADQLSDSSSCFDLAVAQWQADEQEYAPGTLRSCLTETSPARDPALLALARLVLTYGAGAGELAGLVDRARDWRPGPGRLGVLHAGLVCAPAAALAGFPAGQWNAGDMPANGFGLLAGALRSGPVGGARPKGITDAAPQPLPPPASSPRPVSPPRSGPRPVPRPPAPKGPALNGRKVVWKTESQARAEQQYDHAEVMEHAHEVAACLARQDLEGAEKALAWLKDVAPLHSMTWGAERQLLNSKNSGRQARTAVTKSAPSVTSTSARSKDPFSRVVEAMRRNDLVAGKQLLKQAIAQTDHPARGVRRIANLLSTRMKERDEALALLDEHKYLFRTAAERWGWSQERSTVLEHAGRWQEASDELQRMLSQATADEERVRLIGRIAVALLKSFQYEKARQLLEQELRRNPGQPSLQKALDQLIQAMETGVYSKVEATLQLQATATSDLSPLLSFHLDRCEYRGVRAETIASRNFTEDDIKRLDDLVSGRAKKRVLGSDYPRERADYNLSAARIMRDLEITDDRFRSRLRYFAAAMGDACALEARVNPDIIRTYYSEAVSVKGAWDDLVDVKLRQLVMSFTYSDARLLEMGQLPSLEKALALVMAERHLSSMVLVTLLAIPTTGETATRLIRRIWADKGTREVFQAALTAHLEQPTHVADETGFTKAWVAAAEQDHNRRKAYRQISVLAESAPVLTALDRHTAELQRISEDMESLASATDQVRLAQCLKIVTDIREYAAQGTYVERERLFGMATRAIRDHLVEFETSPTVVSLEFLHPYLSALEEQLRGHFGHYETSAEPDNLKVELVVDRYLPSGGKVNVQLQVSNAPGASPVSNVELVVTPSDDYRAPDGTVAVAESIAAGESKTCQLSLFVSKPAIEQELITLSCQISFTLRSQRRVTAPVEPKSIRLHADEEWTEIPNPYIAGVAVENPDMFMGRDRLIADLVNTVAGPHKGNVIVYGQKRAGKSSVLFHLSKALTRPTLAVSFSVQDLAGGVTHADLLYKIGDEFYWALSNLVEEEAAAVGPPPEPDLTEIRLAPQQKFTEYMRRLQAWLNRTGFSGSHLVLLVDEFSMVHKEIRTGGLPPDFMKGWKAMLEKGFFRCVLVGNDLMPRFVQEFANEFQVAGEERVSYLDEASARELIIKPIRFPDGTSRYRGNAVERILELTGNSPYYIQLFCHDLVQYMNSEDVRAPAIGPADVEAVADKLIVNLGRNQFDNLLTPGDSEVTDISGDLVIDVLRATRREAGPNMYHETGVNDHPEAEHVIQDLERREVLKRLSGNRYRIRVGLFSEWLQHRWT